MSSEAARKVDPPVKGRGPLNKRVNIWDRFWPYLLLGGLCACLYLPGLATIPPVDRDEAHFAQATREMRETGDYVDVRYRGHAWHKKPVGTFWLQLAAIKVAGVEQKLQIWLFRIPSVLGSLAAVLLTFVLWRSLFGRDAALLAAALLACACVTVAEAHMAIPDAPLLAAVVAAQGALAKCYLADKEASRAGPGLAIVFWVALAIGTLVKGPVLPALSAMTLVALGLWDRRWGWMRVLRPSLGLAIFLAIAGPWAVAAAWTTRGQFFVDLFYQDYLPRLTSGYESHGAPPGYYIVVSIVSFWPLTLFVPLAIAFAWRNRLDPAVRFCVAWIVPHWVFMEMVPTKLPQYVLPVLPAIALISAKAIEAFGSDRKPVPRWFRGWLAACAPVALGLGASLAAIPWVLERRFDFIALSTGTLIVVASLVVIVLALRRAFRQAAWLSVAASALVFLLLLSLVIPSIEALWVSFRVRQAAVEASSDSPRLELAATGFDEPSLVLLFGSKTAILSPHETARFIRGDGVRFALVADELSREFEASARSLGVRAVRLRSITGLNYSRGRWVTLHIYRADLRPIGDYTTG